MESAKRILVIDDDIGMADLLADFCEEMGCEVRCVTDGREALRAAIDFRPHLVTLDLEMPFVDGFEVLRLLRAHPATNRTPVVVVSVIAEDSDLTADTIRGKLAKPVRYAVFAEKIQALLNPAV
jgi:CheY-like chemotaxis protein